jgi:glucose-6-phosphate isomerase, archaeal
MIPWEGPLPDPQVRTTEEIRALLFDPGCKGSGTLYLMYRDLARSTTERRWLLEHELRYDITVIPPQVLCREYVKTKGHYHPDNPAGVGYPEVYEVLEGFAHYLVQNRDLSDIALFSAGAGDKVIIPPGYGHVTINPSKQALVMANLVSTAFVSDYREYEARHGAAYYELEGEKFIKNPHYPDIPVLRRLGPSKTGHLLPDVSLHAMIGNESLSFLNRPEEYEDALNRLTGDDVQEDACARSS